MRNIDLENEFNEQFDLYVPKEGMADSGYGEVLRAIGRVWYRYYNDDDVLYDKDHDVADTRASIERMRKLLELPQYIYFSLMYSGGDYEKAINSLMKWAINLDIEKTNERMKGFLKEERVND